MKPRIRDGFCRYCKRKGKLIISNLLGTELCSRCLFQSAAQKGWLRDSDVQLLPDADGERSTS